MLKIFDLPSTNCIKQVHARAYKKSGRRAHQVRRPMLSQRHPRMRDVERDGSGQTMLLRPPPSYWKEASPSSRMGSSKGGKQRSEKRERPGQSIGEWMPQSQVGGRSLAARQNGPPSISEYLSQKSRSTIKKVCIIVSSSQTV